MSDQVYKLYASVAASTPAAASIDIQFDGLIEGVLMDLSCTGADALNDGATAEVSFASTAGFTSNDTRASFAGVSAFQGFLTSGGSQVGKSVFVTLGKGIPVAAGERIYLHIGELVSVTAAVRVWIYTATIGGERAQRRRI